MDQVILSRITNLTPSAWRMLITMAKLAHDDTPSYWAGVPYLQLAMGIDRRRAMRLISELEAAGYISRSNKRQGRKRVYELHIPDPLRPVDDLG